MSRQESLDRIRFYLTQLEQRGNAKAPILLTAIENASVDTIVEAFRRYLGWEVFTRPYGPYAQAWCADGRHANGWRAADDAEYASLRALEYSLQWMVWRDNYAKTS